MRAKSVLILGAVVACAFAAQDGFKFERRYTGGEADTYNMSASLESSLGPIDLAMTMTQAVKKVYDNGDADIETTIESLKVNAMGRERDEPARPPTMSRLNKRGAPIPPAAGTPAGGGGQGRMGMFLNFARFAGVMSDAAMKVGVAIPFEDVATGTKGTVTLESITDGVAILVSKAEVKNAEGGAPMTVDTRAWVVTASSKFNKLEGTVKNPPAQPQLSIDSIKMTMSRKKG